MGFIEEIAPFVQKYSVIYGIKVNSPIIAQAILESGMSSSTKAKYHNYFGLKYRANRVPCANGYFYDGGSEQNKDGTYTPLSNESKWFNFVNMENGVEGYFQFINTPTYANLKGVTDPRRYLELIKADGYATSLKYVDNLMNVIKKYNLTQYDNVTDIKKEEVNDNMGYTLKTNYALKSNYGSYRDPKNIKYIVVHFTANDGDSDESNAKFFKNAYRGASAHYFVDDDSITISVPDNYVAWSVGGARYTDYKATGGARLYKICTNANSINIEMCDTLKNGIVMATEKTMQNTVELIKELMAKYSIPIDNVVTHHIVTGKHCPAYFMNEGEWAKFKARINSSISAPTPTTVAKVEDKPINKQKAINKAVQLFINEYLGVNLTTDGIIGKNSKAMLNKCLQKALGTSQTGVITDNNLKLITYSKVKDSRELTKVLEAYLFVRGYNPQDFSGTYTDGVKDGVKEFQKSVFKSVNDIDGLAGKATFSKIVF